MLGYYQEVGCRQKQSKKKGDNMKLFLCRDDEDDTSGPDYDSMEEDSYP